MIFVPYHTREMLAEVPDLPELHKVYLPELIGDSPEFQTNVLGECRSPRALEVRWERVLQKREEKWAPHKVLVLWAQDAAWVEYFRCSCEVWEDWRVFWKKAFFHLHNRWGFHPPTPNSAAHRQDLVIENLFL